VKYLTSCVAAAQHVLPTADGFMQFPEDFYPTGSRKILPGPESLRQFFIETSIIGEIILSFGTERRLLTRILSGIRIAPMSSTSKPIKEEAMKQNRLLITGSVLVAAWMTTGTAMAQSSGSGDTGRSSSGSAQPSKEVHPSVNTSKGQSKSERADETGTPLPKGSPYAGTVEKGASSSANSGTDASTSQSGRRTSSNGRMARSGSAANIKEAQQALKDKGYDPGAVDGVMGAKTKEALKSFQNASNLQATGTLDAQTAEKLGVQSGSLSSRSSSASSRDNMKSSNTTVGKDTDQPNQTPSKNR
jgi:Putative peptidoglycan binding domain